MKNLLAFSGSARLNSLNSLLLSRAVETARELGAVVETIDLRALKLPLYDGDLEAANGLPEGARLLKEAMREVDGFLIASPEYNSFPTPLLLNALDWASRADRDGEAPLEAFRGKTAGLIAASPGPLGGLRSLWTLRTLLQNIQVTVAPSLCAIGGVTETTFHEPDFSSSRDGRRLRTTLEELLRLSV